jgi:pyridoxamine 5'-phosphate oxidase
MDFHELRRELITVGLRRENVAPDPISQFRDWYETMVAALQPDMVPMTLATADATGRPTARLLLLKEFDDRGFVFYTNYRSRKARELAENPRACMVFFWPELDRQVRIEGTTERISAEESDAYFASRPRGSQIGAWASDQSAILSGRDELETAVAAAEQRYQGVDVPRPDWWGGYRLIPETVEFWQGRPDRLHDRLEYVRQPDGGWLLRRLAP